MSKYDSLNTIVITWHQVTIFSLLEWKCCSNFVCIVYQSLQWLSLVGTSQSLETGAGVPVWLLGRLLVGTLQSLKTGGPFTCSNNYNHKTHLEWTKLCKAYSWFSYAGHMWYYTRLTSHVQSSLYTCAVAKILSGLSHQYCISRNFHEVFIFANFTS